MTLIASCKAYPKDERLSGWYHCLAKTNPLASLAGHQQVDVVIIGAGFAGLAAAYRLQQNDSSIKIVVLEAQRLGWAANGRNSGFMIDLPHELNSDNYAGSINDDLTQIEDNRRAIKFVSKLVDEFQLDGCFSPIGKYHGATNGAGLKALHQYSRHLDLINEPYQLLDRSELQAHIGTDYYDGGLYTPGAALLQPAGYIQGLGTALDQKQNLSVYECSPALQIDARRDGVSITTPGGKVDASSVVLANNGHIESFGLAKGRLLHFFTYASLTEPLSEPQFEMLGEATCWGLIPASPMGSTLRKLENRRLLVRNQWTYNPSLTSHDKDLERYAIQHDRCMIERYPHLAKTKIEYRWSGAVAMSLNSAPVFGELQPNVYAAAGCQGLGTTKSTLFGMMIADKLCGKSSATLDRLENSPEPTKLPPRWLNRLGIPAYLKWQHWKAGKDL